GVRRGSPLWLFVFPAARPACPPPYRKKKGKRRSSPHSKEPPPTGCYSVRPSSLPPPPPAGREPRQRIPATRDHSPAPSLGSSTVEGSDRRGGAEEGAR